MSYILEALKKSEQERERGNVPDIKSIHSNNDVTTHDSKRSWWPYILVLVVLINGAIFGVIYLGGKDSNSTGSVSNEPQVASLSDEKSVIDEPVVVEKPEPVISSQQQTTEVPVKPAAVPKPQPKPQPKVIFSKEPLDMSSDVVASKGADGGASQPSAIESDATQESIEENIQAVLISELPENVRQSIPNIEFAGHVYSTSVERRSVMINGKKMREGDAVNADLFLHAITPEGAEFDYQGYRFKLNALQDWSFR
ncbi:general secretion pathway protein GspB [Kaarinaea lacus]